MHKANKCLMLSGLCALALTFLAGPETGHAARAKKQQRGGGDREIAFLTLNLPEGVRWQRNDAAQQGLTEWFVQGTSSRTSPVRVLYQKVGPARPAAELRRQITATLKNCPDSRTVNLQKASRYPNQTGFGAYCSKLGQADFGLMSYVSIFSDNKVNHIILSEARVPVSATAGKLTGPNAAQGQRRADMMRQIHRTLRVCDKNKRCI